MAEKNLNHVKDTINLIPSQEFKEEPVGQFLKWSETVGKVIVVLTEAIVLIVFLARFKLDAQILDLKQEITTKAQLVQSLQSFEGQFKTLQKNLNSAEKTNQQIYLPASTLALVEQKIPLDVFLVEETLTAQKTTLRGRSASYNSVSTFWKSLEKSTASSKQQVILTSLGREEIKSDTAQPSTFVVNFSLEIKKAEPKTQTEATEQAQQTPQT